MCGRLEGSRCCDSFPPRAVPVTYTFPPSSLPSPSNRTEIERELQVLAAILGKYRSEDPKCGRRTRGRRTRLHKFIHDISLDVIETIVDGSSEITEVPKPLWSGIDPAWSPRDELSLVFVFGQH